MGLALATYEPPTHHIPDDIYQVPDGYQIRDDIYIVPEDPYTTPDDSFDPGQRDDQQYNIPNHGSSEHNNQDGVPGDPGVESEGSEFEISWTGIGYFVLKEVIMGTFDLIVDQDPTQWRNIDWKRLDWKSLGFSTVKSAIGELLPDGPYWAKLYSAGSDAVDAVGKYKHVMQFLKSPSEIKTIFQAALQGGQFGSASGLKTFFSNIAKPLQTPAGIMGKVAPWLAVVSGVFSIFDAWNNFSEGNIASGFQDVGNILMSGAVVLAATGAGAPVAAAVAIAGGVLWLGATIVKHREVIGDFIGTVTQATGKVVRKTGEFVGNRIKSISKSGGNAVRGIGKAVGMEKAGNAFGGAIEGTGKVLGNVIEKTGDFIGSTQEKVGGWFKSWGH